MSVALCPFSLEGRAAGSLWQACGVSPSDELGNSHVTPGILKIVPETLPRRHHALVWEWEVGSGTDRWEPPTRRNGNKKCTLGTHGDKQECSPRRVKTLMP